MASQSVTVIILTRMRHTLLARALASLNDQRDVNVLALVVIDDCYDTLESLNSLTFGAGAIIDLRHKYVRRTNSDYTGPIRAGKLRQTSLDQVEGEWVAFLDDDNTLVSNHYTTLLQFVDKRNSPVAHSWRSLWNRDLSPHPLRSLHPWCRDQAMAEALFRKYALAGIYKSGSNIVRDQVIPGNPEESMVDTSEWIFHRDFASRLSWVGSFELDDWRTSRAEDSVILDQIVNLRLTVPSSRLPTLRYFLGGYSNQMIDETTDSKGWLVE